MSTLSATACPLNRLVHPILDLYRQAYPVLYPLLSPFPAGFALVKLLHLDPQLYVRP